MTLVLVRSIYRANKAQNKRAHLENFLDDFEILKLEIRLCVDLKILPVKKQVMLAKLMEGIGKQVWLHDRAVTKLRPGYWLA